MSGRQRTPYRFARRLVRDLDYFQACAYGFAFALAVVTLAVGPILWHAVR